MNGNHQRISLSLFLRKPHFVHGFFMFLCRSFSNIHLILFLVFWLSHLKIPRISIDAAAAVAASAAAALVSHCFFTIHLYQAAEMDAYRRFLMGSTLWIC